MSTNVKVKGLSELAKFMAQLPEKLEKNVMRGAIRAGAKVLAEETIKNVPVDMGDLKKSIRISTRNKKTGEILASVKSDLFYSRMVEYGTAAHWIKVSDKAKPRGATVKTLNKELAKGSLRIGVSFVGQSVQHPGARPHPYMRPALDAKSAEALVAAGNYIKKRLATKHGIDTSDVNVEAEGE